MTEFHQVLSAFSFSPVIDTPYFVVVDRSQSFPSLGVLEGFDGGRLKRLGKNGVVV